MNKIIYNTKLQSYKATKLQSYKAIKVLGLLAISTVISSDVEQVAPFTDVAASFQTQNPYRAAMMAKFNPNVASRSASWTTIVKAEEVIPSVSDYMPAGANDKILNFLDYHSRAIYSQLARFQNKEYTTDKERTRGFREIVEVVSKFKGTDYNESIKSKLTEYMAAILRSDEGIQGEGVSAAIHQTIKDFHQKLKDKSSDYMRIQFAMVLENIYWISRDARFRRLPVSNPK